MRIEPVLFLSGPPGVGKTTVSWAIFDQLVAQGSHPALVDFDLLGACWPVPDDDPYNNRLKAANLRAVWTNFRSSGATCLVAAGVVEDRRVLDLYSGAITNAKPVLCRLRATHEQLTARIRQRGRERGAELDKLSRRAEHLADQLQRNDIADFTIDTDGRDADEVAHLVLSHGEGWPMTGAR